MSDYPERLSRSSLPQSSSDEHAFRSSGIGRGSSSGATPEQLFVSWHCTHGTVDTPSILVSTDSGETVTPPAPVAPKP